MVPRFARFRRATALLSVLFTLGIPAPTLGQLPSGRPSDLRVSFIDVGQGDAIWIKTPDTGSGSKNILIDGGPDRRARNRLTKYLATYGVPPGSVIDYVIVTHPHDDHYPALIDVLALYKVKNIVDSGFEKHGEYDDFLSLVAAEKVNGRKATLVNLRDTPDYMFDLGDDVKVRLLHVDSAGLDTTMGRGNTRENNASTVIRLEMGKFSFLFMGDAEGKKRESSPDKPTFVEKVLLEKLKPNDLETDVLKAGHHGSETGSTTPFLNAVQARIVVVMSGRRSFNGRSIPDESVIDRYHDLESKPLVIRTDENDEAEGRTTKDDQDGDDVYMRTDGQTLRVYQAVGPVGRRRWAKIAQLMPRRQ